MQGKEDNLFKKPGTKHPGTNKTDELQRRQPLQKSEETTSIKTTFFPTDAQPPCRGGGAF